MNKIKDRYLNYINAIDKFNAKHKKYICYYKGDNNLFELLIKDKNGNIHIEFRLILDEFKPIDEIVEVLEDLKKDFIKC